MAQLLENFGVGLGQSAKPLLAVFTQQEIGMHVSFALAKSKRKKKDWRKKRICIYLIKSNEKNSIIYYLFQVYKTTFFRWVNTVKI